MYVERYVFIVDNLTHKGTGHLHSYDEMNNEDGGRQHVQPRGRRSRAPINRPQPQANTAVNPSQSQAGAPINPSQPQVDPNEQASAQGSLNLQGCKAISPCARVRRMVAVEIHDSFME